MKIKIVELETATQKLFEHLKELGIESVELDKDYYWDIEAEDLYNPYQQPKDIGLGQLYDDWEEVQIVLTEKSEPLSIDFKAFAAIFRYLGEHTSE